MRGAVALTLPVVIYAERGRGKTSLTNLVSLALGALGAMVASHTCTSEDDFDAVLRGRVHGADRRGVMQLRANAGVIVARSDLVSRDMALVALDVRAVEPSYDREEDGKDPCYPHEPLSGTAQDSHGKQQGYDAADGDDSPRMAAFAHPNATIRPRRPRVHADRSRRGALCGAVRHASTNSLGRGSMCCSVDT